jgi:site-specific recombinase XerD
VQDTAQISGTATSNMLSSLHQLRHTRASELVKQGQRLAIVQRVLRHRDPRSTQGYAELNEALVRAALAFPNYKT